MNNELVNVINDWESSVYGLAQIFNIELDKSEHSIENIEVLCENIYNELLANPNIAEETVEKTARMIGAYLGNVIINNIGGEWRLTEDKNIAIINKRVEIYPIIKVYKRLKNGSEENISFFYKVFKNELVK